MARSVGAMPVVLIPAAWIVYTGMTHESSGLFLVSGTGALLGASVIAASIGGSLDAMNIGILLVGGGQSAAMAHTVAGQRTELYVC